VGAQAVERVAVGLEAVQEEAAMERRHAKSPSVGPNATPKLGAIGDNAKRALIAKRSGRAY